MLALEEDDGPVVRAAQADRRLAVEGLGHHQVDLPADLLGHHREGQAEQAVVLEARARLAQSLHRVHEGLQADAGGVAQERVRVEQPVDDQVVGGGRGPQPGPGVVHDLAHARVFVGVLGMVEEAQAQDHGVDLDRVDVLRPGAQGRRHVVARARSQHRHLPRRPVHAVGHLVIEADAPRLLRSGLGRRREVVDLLVVVAGGADDGQATLSGAVLDDLVRRVDALPLEGDRPGQHDGSDL